MKLKSLSANATVLITNHGYEILYSYDVPVAGYSPVIGYFKSSEQHPKATVRHINKYLAGDNAVALSSEQIESIGGHIS